MSVPPPPDQWGSQPPTGGQPVGAPQWGPPPGGQPGGAPQWGPQQPWGPPPPSRGGKGMWILGGIAVLAVIAVTVVITVLVVGKDSGGGESPTPTNGNGSDIASANDKGPANIIDGDPTCDSWSRVGTALSAAEEKVGWANRDSSIPASVWTPEQRTMYETVSKAMTDAAEQTVGLVKLTPHRVMRELYEQFIAYTRAFTNAISSYTSTDSHLAGAVDSLSSVPGDLCGAARYGSAATQIPLIPVPKAPSELSPIGDPSSPRQFLTTSNPVCGEWLSAFGQLLTDTSAWRAIDPNIPAAQWNSDQKAVVDAVGPVMEAFADKSEELGRRSGNPTFEDFAVLSAQYRRAYVLTFPTYTPADDYLVSASTSLAMSVNAACSAVQG
jgi:hypothetical protein